MEASAINVIVLGSVPVLIMGNDAESDAFKGPNLWALITKLTSQATPMRKRQGPYKVLMSLLTLCYSGDVAVSKLLAYLERRARG